MATDYQASLRVLNALPRSFISKMIVQETNLVLMNLQGKFEKAPEVL